jgi:hypothetical protein
MKPGQKNSNQFKNLSATAGPDDCRNHGGGMSNHLSAAFQAPAWQRERLHRMHRVLLGIEDRLSLGQTLDKAVRYFVKVNRNRYFHSDPARRIRFSNQTILRLLYIWRAGGKTPESLELHYGRTSKINGGDLKAFLRAAARPAVVSFAQARECSRTSKATASGFWYALDETGRRAILLAFDLRREAIRFNKCAAQIFRALIDK